MTTLESIGFTCALGVTAFTASSIAFGCAIRRRSVFVSPRCIARPPSVIYNPAHPAQHSAAVGGSFDHALEQHDDADRGYCNAMFPAFGWIPWVLSIPYDTMLKGVPGTGTRDNGRSGVLLKLNLDAIVLLRFHVVGLKLSALATVLLLLIMLPIYKTSACFGETADPSLSLYVITTTSTNMSSTSTTSTSTTVYSDGYFYTTSNTTGETVVQAPTCNLTNYERLTMANIPSLAQVSTYGESFVHPQESGILSKLYACCFIFLIMMIYLLYLLQQEWVQILAMRRVYYFERDIWRQRQQEQLELATAAAMTSSSTSGNAPPSSLTSTKRSKKERHLVEREPWVPHPEHPDTVPSIALYSVLVGGIPPPPPRRRRNCQYQSSATTAMAAAQESSITGNDNADNNTGNVDKNKDVDNAADDALSEYDPWSKRESIDWQLSLCGAFFDHCVPNQPGFSSSVAAVSILPGVRDISIAWKKWYTAAAKLRRLRFIRKQITKKTGDDGDEENQVIREGPNIGDDSDNNISNNIHEDDYFFVNNDDEDDEDAYIASLQFGPEQTAVYSREFAAAAAPCCPNGCMEGRVREATLNDLRGMERETEDEMRVAFLDLRKARHAVVTEQDMLVSADKTAHRNDVVVATMTPVSPLASPTEQGQTLSNPTRRHSSSIRQDLIHNAEYLVESVAGAQNIGSTTTWTLVQQVISERSSTIGGIPVKISDGIFRWPNVRDCARSCGKQTIGWIQAAFTYLFTRTKKAVDLSSESTYAVVTFTSRQAAVAARHNLSDGRGLENWLNLVDIPVPPLADGDSIGIRSCCRPITLTIEDRHKTWRYWFAVALNFSIYVFYTVPLTLASNLVNPASLQQVFPKFFAWAEAYLPNAGSVISGALQALIWSTFFASCPSLFKFIANSGSNATSFANAELSALKYFWWFMVVTAFSGPLLANMFLNGWNAMDLTNELMAVLRSIAVTVPTTQAAAWINWMITQGSIMLPMNYLLNINTFIFHWLGIPCCSRLMVGGGPGGPLPYRIYVDTGVAILCVLALAPASPIVAPACLLYFMYGQPLLRRNMIFVYRPRFDGGGHRWPFLFDMVISALLMGQILLCMQMVLKAAVGPAIVAGLPIVVTCLYYKAMNKRYRRPFKDTALLQTSLLDGWDTRKIPAFEEREEFRKFLVDSHKAAYVPVCIAGDDKETTLTSEPAVTIPVNVQETAEFTTTDDVDSADSSVSQSHKQVSRDTSRSISHQPRVIAQRGATLRRTAHVLMSLRKSDPTHSTPSPAMPLQSPPTHTQSTPAPLDMGNGSAMVTSTSLFAGDIQLSKTD